MPHAGSGVPIWDQMIIVKTHLILRFVRWNVVDTWWPRFKVGVFCGVGDNQNQNQNRCSLQEVKLTGPLPWLTLCPLSECWVISFFVQISPLAGAGWVKVKVWSVFTFFFSHHFASTKSKYWYVKFYAIIASQTHFFKLNSENLFLKIPTWKMNYD